MQTNYSHFNAIEFRVELHNRIKHIECKHIIRMSFINICYIYYTNIMFTQQYVDRHRILHV